MPHNFNGYTLLELSLVTTFITIFLIVVNPATYMSQFSSLLLKIDMMGQAELIKTKFMDIEQSDCEVLDVAPTVFQYRRFQLPFTFDIQNNALRLTNAHNQSATFISKLDESINGFQSIDAFFDQTSQISDTVLIDYKFTSAENGLYIKGSLVCEQSTVVLNTY